MKNTYQHKKSGRLYEVLSEDVINATNTQDGQRMVYYKGTKKDDSGIGYFVREVDEFYNKFVKMSEEQAKKIRFESNVLDIIHMNYRPDEYQDPHYRLRDDVGLDSLDIIELIMNVENEYNIAISDDIVEILHDMTIREFCDCIYENYLKS